ncbi:hypothetical protein SAMN05421676_10281 [Salinibacillus kushneri]|uniref:Uncharacterized protein n=1 Tax=Salinibacillus kushneri TaxID=237682 RepID=A0A1I0A9D8_9BACI|nr:hypothetical protein SAMN05421676_10281 [Salinibacillus kushneri]
MVKDSHAPKKQRKDKDRIPDEQKRGKGKSNTRGGRN